MWKNTVGHSVLLKVIEHEKNVRLRLYLHNFNYVTKTVLKFKKPVEQLISFGWMSERYECVLTVILTSRKDCVGKTIDI